MNVIGIDPGKSGGLAVLTPNHKASVFRFDNLSEREVYLLLTGQTLDLCHVFLEKVHAMPGQGVTSMFNFGCGYGFLRGVLTTLGVPYEDVPPQTWQKKLGLGAKYNSYADRKRAHKAQAEQWFPSTKITLSDADALLIAEYGYRTLNRL